MDVTRRRVLLGGAACAGLIGANELYEDDDGVSWPVEHGAPSGLQQYLDRVYDTDVDELFTHGERDLVVEVRTVGDQYVSIAPADRERIKDRFAEHGVNLSWLEYPAAYDEDWFRDRYAPSAKPLLWGAESFYAEQVEPAARRHFVQAVITPYDELGGCEAEAEQFSGYATHDRFALAHDAGAITVMHELGHIGGLDHDYDDDGNSGVMGQQDVLDFTETEWETFKQGYDDRVRRELPGFFFDIGCQLDIGNHDSSEARNDG